MTQAQIIDMKILITLAIHQHLNGDKLCIKTYSALENALFELNSESPNLEKIHLILSEIK